MKTVSKIVKIVEFYFFEWWCFKFHNFNLINKWRKKLTLKAVDFHEIIGNKEAITLAQGLQQNKVVELLNLYGKKKSKKKARLL